MIRHTLMVAAALAFCVITSPAHAQTAPSTNALTTCVGRSATQEDSVVTARWLFIAMSRHPSLPQSVRVGDDEGLEANQRMGALVNRLLFETCAEETRIAVAAAGYEAAFEATFSALGEKAMTDLMSNADVMASIIQLGAYTDLDRLRSLPAAPK